MVYLHRIHNIIMYSSASAALQGNKDWIIFFIKSISTSKPQTSYECRIAGTFGIALLSQSQVTGPQESPKTLPAFESSPIAHRVKRNRRAVLNLVDEMTSTSLCR